MSARRGPAAAARRLASLSLVSCGALAFAGCSAMPFGHKHPVAPAPPPVGVTTPPDTTAAKPAPDTTGAEPAPKRAATSPSKAKSTAHAPAGADSVAMPSQPVTPVETMDPEERARTLSRTVSDTTAAGQALRRCTGRAVMPDQEATLDAVRSLLAQTSAALVSGELWRAESLARKARQLASSLNCP